MGVVFKVERAAGKKSQRGVRGGDAEIAEKTGTPRPLRLGVLCVEP
jgi:hypothetical protein